MLQYLRREIKKVRSKCYYYEKRNVTKYAFNMGLLTGYQNSLFIYKLKNKGLK